MMRHGATTYLDPAIIVAGSHGQWAIHQTLDTELVVTTAGWVADDGDVFPAWDHWTPGDIGFHHEYGEGTCDLDPTTALVYANGGTLN
jgi:hypothetical protein